MKLSATLTNADHVKLGIRNLGAALPDIAFDDIEVAMNKAAKQSVPYTGGNSYAVPLTDSGIDMRTGNLGRSVQVYRRGASTVIEAAAYRRGHEYTQYVIGDREGQGQAGVHQGRWITMRDAVDYQLTELVDTLDKDIQEKINRELG